MWCAVFQEEHTKNRKNITVNNEIKLKDLEL